MAKTQEYRLVGPFTAFGPRADALATIQRQLDDLGEQGWILPINELILINPGPMRWSIVTDGTQASEFLARRTR